MKFQISGLSPEPFRALFELSDAELAARGAKRMVVEEPHSVPCRVSLVDAAPGEEVLLLPYQHLDGPSPYQSKGPIFVRKRAKAAARFQDSIPELQRRRLSSARAYDEHRWLLESDVVPGVELNPLVRRLLADPRVSFVDVHNARPGCFAFRIARA
jgi:hypothetical protein